MSNKELIQQWRTNLNRISPDARGNVIKNTLVIIGMAVLLYPFVLICAAVYLVLAGLIFIFSFGASKEFLFKNDLAESIFNSLNIPEIIDTAFSFYYLKFKCKECGMVVTYSARSNLSDVRYGTGSVWYWYDKKERLCKDCLNMKKAGIKKKF